MLSSQSLHVTRTGTTPPASGALPLADGGATVNTGLGPIFDADPADDAISEYGFQGDRVGVTVRAVDPDGDPVTYSFYDPYGPYSTDLLTVMPFDIDPNTGVITMSQFGYLDYDSYQSYDLVVQATDGVHTVQAPVTIAVIDEPPADFSDAPRLPRDRDPAPNYVYDGIATGTPVGYRAYSNLYGGADGQITYSLSNDAGGRFAIDPETGIVTVADGSLIDRDTADSHTIRVVATNHGGVVPLHTADTVTIPVTLGDPPPDDGYDEPIVLLFDGDPADNVISEHAFAGATVGITAKAIDVDGDPIEYSIESNGPFTIDPVTGVVSVVPGFLLYPYEECQSYDVIIKASSNYSPWLEKSLTISVIDEPGPRNSLPSWPVDVDPAPDAVPEGAATGTPVGITALSIDPDVGDQITYSLTYDGEGRFAIDPVTGVVTVADGSLLDDEAGAIHYIEVRATDNGSPYNYYESFGFMIEVTGVAEPAYSGASPLAGMPADERFAGLAVGGSVSPDFDLAFGGTVTVVH